MTLKDITAISGKPGLFKILKTTRTGMIVEALGAKKTKMTIGASHRASILKDISVYTTTEEESVFLAEIFKKIKEIHNDKIEVDVKSTDALKDFLEEILPEYDREKVYPSDMKKMVNWYNLLSEELPEIIQNLEQEKEEEVSTAEDEDGKEEQGTPDEDTETKE